MLADVTGLIRSGWATLGWSVVMVGAVAIAGRANVIDARSPLVLPLLLVVAHIAATGLCRGLQAQAASAGQPSLLGLTWSTESMLHLAPVAVLQVVASVVAGLLTGASAGPMVIHTLAVVPLLAGGQLLYAYKGPPPVSLMFSSGGGGIAVARMMHPAIVVAIGAAVAALGGVQAFVAGALCLLLGMSRAQAGARPAVVA